MNQTAVSATTRSLLRITTDELRDHKTLPSALTEIKESAGEATPITTVTTVAPKLTRFSDQLVKKRYLKFNSASNYAQSKTNQEAVVQEIAETRRSSLQITRPNKFAIFGTNRESKDDFSLIQKLK